MRASLLTLLVSLLTLAVGSRALASTPAAKTPPPSFIVGPHSAAVRPAFYDSGLVNLDIPDDEDLEPARKCKSCFG